MQPDSNNMNARTLEALYYLHGKPPGPPFLLTKEHPMVLDSDKLIDEKTTFKEKPICSPPHFDSARRLHLYFEETFMSCEEVVEAMIPGQVAAVIVNEKGHNHYACRSCRKKEECHFVFRYDSLVHDYEVDVHHDQDVLNILCETCFDRMYKPRTDHLSLASRFNFERSFITVDQMRDFPFKIVYCMECDEDKNRALYTYYPKVWRGIYIPKSSSMKSARKK